MDYQPHLNVHNALPFFRINESSIFRIDPFVSLLVNDKEYTKKVLRSVDILTPISILVADLNNLINKLYIANMPIPLCSKNQIVKAHH